jgi:hypothetical protein
VPLLKAWILKRCRGFVLIRVVGKNGSYFRLRVHGEDGVCGLWEGRLGKGWQPGTGAWGPGEEV